MGRLTAKIKNEILRDYREWSGGYGPEHSMNGREKFLQMGLPNCINPREVMAWWETLILNVSQLT